MCGKLGTDEIESLENMMSMAVYFVLADTFDKDIDEISPDARLTQDLSMTAKLQRKLKASMTDNFNDIRIDFTQVQTVQDLLDRVAKVRLH